MPEQFPPSVTTICQVTSRYTRLEIQATLGFATKGLAANLGAVTATLLTDLSHYIIATLGITTFNFVANVAK